MPPPDDATAVAEPEQETQTDPTPDPKPDRRSEALAFVRERQDQAEGSDEPVEPDRVEEPVEPDPDAEATLEPDDTADEPADEPEVQTVTRWRDPETKKWVKKGTPGAEAVEVKLGAKMAEESAETAEEPTDESAEPEGEPTEPALVSGPGIQEGETVEIDLSKPLDETGQRVVRFWANNGMRRVDFHQKNAAIEREREQFEEFRSMLTERPETVLEHVPAEKREAIALALVSDPEIYEAVADKVEEFQLDPSSRLAAENERLRAERKRQAEAERRKQVERVYGEIEDALIELIPEDAPDEDANAFWRDAVRDIQDEIRDRGRLIDPAEVPKLIERRLSQYGFKDGATTAAESTTPRADAGDPGAGSPPEAEGSPSPADNRSLRTTPAGGGAAGSTGFKGVPEDISLRGDKNAKRFILDRVRGRG